MYAYALLNKRLQDMYMYTFTYLTYMYTILNILSRPIPFDEVAINR